MAFIRCKGYEALDFSVFGTGIDGNLVISSNTVWNASVEDSGVIEKNFNNLTIDSGVTLSAGNRNAGIIIRCLGDCIINGTIENTLSPRTLLNDSNLASYYPSWFINNGCAGDGGNGDSGVSWGSRGSWAGSGGAGMTGRYYGGGIGAGGGGGGGQSTDCYGFNGGSTTDITTEVDNLFVGGSYSTGSHGANGGGGRGGNGSTSGNGGNGDGGVGGNGAYQQLIGDGGGGGGAGNYGGGVIILLVKGILTINGTINCNGRDGGAGGRSTFKNPSGGHGGGGGGGRIYLMSLGTMTRNGEFNVSGATNASNGDKYYIDFLHYRKGAGIPSIIAS